MYFTREIERFPELLGPWREQLEATVLPASLPLESRLEALGSLIEVLERRYREGPDAPLRIALFGPTGGGKSKLFSSLVGRSISPSGFRRPYTRRAFFYLHRRRGDLAASLNGEVALHEDPNWRDVLLIDTPDFDSVELHNREEAERVLLGADAFLFVTDAQKYADASTWEYLDRIFTEEKPCRVIINKTRSDAPIHDFARRLEERWGKLGRDAFGPAFPELAIDDETVIPADTPALVALRGVVAEMVQSQADTRDLVRQAFRIELDRFLVEAALLHNAAKACLASRREVGTIVDRRFVEARGRLGRLLEVQVAGELRRTIYRRALIEIEQLDVLRYPRRLLELPIEGLRGLRGGAEKRSKPNAEDADRIVDESASFPIVEGAILVASDDVRKQIVDSSAFGDLLESERLRAIRLPHSELRSRYAKAVVSLREWMDESARTDAVKPSGDQVVKFYLAQIVLAGVLIAGLVQWNVSWPASILTLFIVCPLAAKGISVALAKERAGRFESAVQDRHAALAGEILEESRERFIAFLDESTGGLEKLVVLLDGIVEYSGREDDVSEGFARKRYTLEPGSDIEMDGSGVSSASAAGVGGGSA